MTVAVTATVGSRLGAGATIGTTVTVGFGVGATVTVAVTTTVGSGLGAEVATTGTVAIGSTALAVAEAVGSGTDVDEGSLSQAIKPASISAKNTAVANIFRFVPIKFICFALTRERDEESATGVQATSNSELCQYRLNGFRARTAWRKNVCSAPTVTDEMRVDKRSFRFE